MATITKDVSSLAKKPQNPKTPRSYGDKVWILIRVYPHLSYNFMFAVNKGYHEEQRRQTVTKVDD